MCLCYDLQQVKISALILFFFLSLAIAHCQTQERKLIDRILKPDMTLGSSFQDQAYEGAGVLSLRSLPDAKAKFRGTRSADVGGFPLTRSFLGIKNPWFGGKVYDTKKAAFWARSLLDPDKKVPVKRAEAVEFYDAGKQANFGSPVVPTRKYVPQGAAPGAVGQITEKIKKEMTIDEVRELLNKPH